jgi:hypothetical protein
MSTSLFHSRIKPCRTLITTAFAGSVAACGGGGGSTNPPELGNRAPSFDQTSYEFSLQENSGTLVGSVSASDPDGDTISLSVSGTDGASFSITSAGEVSFIETPDYEAPIDADSDNRYEVTITASDGELTRSVQTIVDVTNDASDDEVAERTLFGFEVLVGEVLTPDYDRPSTWDDEDGDCISDRHEVLMAQHLDGDGAYPLVMSSSGCFVETGRWLDPYDDIYYYSASNVQIDHVVALYESWISGLGNLSSSLQRRYANTGSLTEGVLPETSHNFLAVGASSNGEKGSSDPTEWMPRNEAYHCTYLKKWVLTKSKNELLFDSAEFEFIQDREADCGNELLPELPPNP